MELFEKEKVFKKLENAVAYAVENNATYIVQIYFNEEEYMGKEDSSTYDVDNIENCTYNFFNSYEGAEKFQKLGIQSYIVGSHQVIVDVKAYLDYYSTQNNVSGVVKKLILQRKTNQSDELPF